MKKIIAVLALFASISSANAADKTWNIGADVGYGTASVAGTTISGFDWGLEVNYLVAPSWTVGVQWNNMKSNGTTIMPIMLTANYTLEGMKGFYIGPRVGLTSTKVDTIDILTLLPTTQSTSDFTVGAQLGYAADIAADWSVGVEADWNYVMNSTQKYSDFNFIVPIKYHF